MAAASPIGHKCKVFFPSPASFRRRPEPRVVRFRPTQSKSETLDAGFRRHDGAARQIPANVVFTLAQV